MLILILFSCQKHYRQLSRRNRNLLRGFSPLANYTDRAIAAYDGHNITVANNHFRKQKIAIKQEL
jgi:hypothetical protein